MFCVFLASKETNRPAQVGPLRLKIKVVSEYKGTDQTARLICAFDS